MTTLRSDLEQLLSEPHDVEQVLALVRERLLKKMPDEEDAQQFAPPEKCDSEMCTSCPEMKGRVNGYKRALIR